MEPFLIVFVMAYSFVMGLLTGSTVRKALEIRKKRHEITEEPLRKPQNQFSEYTIEELEKHKKHCELQYKNSVHYPALRQGYAEDLKLVLEMLDWHYTTNGTKDLEEQRANNKAELDDFDRKYAAALRSIS